MKNILLISYTFPPYPGVGGRRWAKFAKHLAEAGYTVYVICAKNPHKNTSFHINDTQHERIQLYTFRSLFPTILLSTQPKTLFEKIQYKFWMKVLSLFVKGYVYDKAVLDRRKILSLAQKIIKTKNIKNVITTGAPFRINYYALKLKSEFNDVNIITDFRDPWTWGNQYSKLNADRMNFELKMQEQVIEQSNVVTVPVEPMRNYLTQNTAIQSNKVYVLPHAFDEDEIIVKHEYRKNSFKCAFFGTMYSGIETYLEVLCKTIGNNNDKITLDIYPDIIRYQDIIKKYNVEKWVNYKTPLSGKQLFETLSRYDYVVFIYPFFVKDYLSTKFYEIIKSRIPIIYIGEQGVASDFITSNKLGIHFNEQALSSDFQKFIDGEIQFDYDVKYNVDDFSFVEVTKRLTALFK